ncbi:MAG: DUF4367 domain-containing protein, partial [Oscillospiraceae bacterium]
MMDRQLFKETFSHLHASEDTIAEVMKMANTQHDRKTMRRPARMGALIALAAVLLMGSAFAAVTYHLHTEPVGDLALAVSIAAEGDAAGAIAFSGEGAETAFAGLDVTPGWLPEGMVLNNGETTKWSYEDNYARGGFSLGYMPLNTGNATFCELNGDAESQKNLDINGHEAIYIKMARDGFNQRMYISYPEFNAVLTIYIGDDVDFDTAVRFAENLTVAAGDYERSAESLEYDGKRYLDAARAIETGVYVNTADGLQDESETVEASPAQKAAAENMVNAKAVGESFPVSFIDWDRNGNITFLELPVKVVDYAIADDTSILRDPSCLDSYIAGLLDENGKLPEDTLRFYVSGNGITTPSSTVVAEQAQQPKLVAVTFEVTNNTDSTISDIIYGGRLLAVEETADGWAEYKPVPESGAVDYDYFSGESWESLEVMCY